MSKIKSWLDYRSIDPPHISRREAAIIHIIQWSALLLFFIKAKH
jgi:hypothetical protein